MKIVIKSDTYENIIECSDEESKSLLQRAQLSVELWNREHAEEDQRIVIRTPVWPLPEPEPLPE